MIKWFHAENKMKTIRNFRGKGFDKKKKYLVGNCFVGILDELMMLIQPKGCRIKELPLP